MHSATFSRPSGKLIRCEANNGEGYWAFIPGPLPPDLSDSELVGLLPVASEASLALGQLAGLGRLLPNPDHLIRPYMRREAIASSRIENTHTSFAELVAFESSGRALGSAETREVSNYVLALDYGLRRVHEHGITRDLVREIHRKLMDGARGEAFATPGEFRNVQNHIDGRATNPADARYVPPPPAEAMQAIEAFEEYAARADGRWPPLIQAAILHYQFEAIHPFLDGNGRVGRVLIPLFLAHRGQFDHPLLYLSPFFERDRGSYYDLLFAVSAESAWADWIGYFLRGVIDQAHAAAHLAGQIIELGKEWRQRLFIAKATGNANRLAELMLEWVAVSPRAAQQSLGVSAQTAYNSLAALERAGIVREMTGRSRDQIFIADELVEIFSTGI